MQVFVKIPSMVHEQQSSQHFYGDRWLTFIFDSYRAVTLCAICYLQVILADLKLQLALHLQCFMLSVHTATKQDVTWFLTEGKTKTSSGVESESSSKGITT